MKVHVLRHTKPNIETGICYGQSDIALSKSFTEERLLIKENLSDISFECVFSSPLKRCVHLAEFLCPENMKINTDDRLIELNFGTWEMKKWQDISKSKEASEWFKDYVNVKCPQGESFMDLHLRVEEFLIGLKKQNQYKQALIVTHAGVIRTIFSILNSTELKGSFKLNVDYGELKTFHL